MLDTMGEGQYVGCVLSVDAQVNDSWFEGDDRIYIDDMTTPALSGTGTEDYFCNAWGYREPFSYPYYGAPLLEKRADGGLYAESSAPFGIDHIRLLPGEDEPLPAR